SAFQGFPGASSLPRGIEGPSCEYLNHLATVFHGSPVVGDRAADADSDFACSVKQFFQGFCPTSISSAAKALTGVGATAPSAICACMMVPSGASRVSMAATLTIDISRVLRAPSF